MKSNKQILIIIEIALILFLLCSIIFPNVINRTIIGIILLVFMVLTQKLVKSYKVSGKYNKKITGLMFIISLVYLTFLYIIGIYVGFYEPGIKISIRTILKYIIPYIVIIISIENIRKTILLKEEKKASIIVLIITVMLDIALAISVQNVESLKDYFSLITFTVFSSIAYNLLYNYIILRHRNSRAIIVYRIITTIYIYIVSIVPNIHPLFEAIIRVIVPYIIYILLEKMYSKKEKHITTYAKTRDIIMAIVPTTITALIIMLISCQFEYGMLVIGSGSMTGVINKADAIIYKELEKDEKIDIGDVIVFKDSETKIIHRVIDKKDSGIEERYFTKGDANQTEDDGYRIREEIVGKVKWRIPYIGILPVAINDMLK